MNISNSSSYLFHNVTEEESNVFYFLNVLFGLPINSYVIWLIVTGTGNGLAAEIFSLNLAVCEICLCVESVFLFLMTKYQILWIVADILDGVAVTGRPLFQCLMCVERYLAVVHPVTFLKYKPLRYRVICSAIGWVATFVSSGIITIVFNFYYFFFYYVFLLGQFFTFLSIQLFCFVAVLRALKQSGPGERKREREENQMKKRAFYLILITTVTMIILYVLYIVLIVPQLYTVDTSNTFASLSSVCFTLAGLVQPLLFLYRVGKLSFVKVNNSYFICP